MKTLFAFVIALWLGGALAQQELEVIPLKARTVDQVLPVLQPMVEPGGALSGMNNQLFLRASKRNRDEIKRALATIDTPARKLIIRVSQTRGADTVKQGGKLEGQVTLGSTKRVDANAQVWDTRNQRQESGSQMVQTVEGGRAFIQVGRSLPIPLRQVVVGPNGAVVTDSVVYRDIGQGFYAEPRVAGQRVTLEISQQADTPAHLGPGSANVQRLSTTVSGRLGEWIELGGSGRQAMGSQQGGTSLSTSEIRDNRSIWLKVEEVP
ncbi:MAG: hypothetical protein ACM3SV_03900 [Betaproteobacteria bacterium]